MDSSTPAQTSSEAERVRLIELIVEHQKSALTLARRILLEPEEARDAVQDAFLQAYSNLDRFDPNRDFRKWLFSIVIKRCLDRWRRRKTYLRFLPRYLHYQDLVKPAKNSGSTGNIQALMDRLNTRERAILSLYFQEELTTAEIAGVMNCAESTIRVHLFNARRKIKKEMNRVSSI